MSKQSSSLLHIQPPQLTSFIGREAEIAGLRNLLTDPTCRLLTVVGIGGIGKTRLAIEATATLIDNFDQGVYFVPLQGIYAGEFLVSAMAEATNFSFSGQQEPLAQMLNYLSGKTMLLLLDNFEQLVGWADLQSRRQLVIANGLTSLSNCILNLSSVITKSKSMFKFAGVRCKSFSGDRRFQLITALISCNTSAVVTFKSRNLPQYLSL